METQIAKKIQIQIQMQIQIQFTACPKWQIWFKHPDQPNIVQIDQTKGFINPLIVF